MVRGNMGATFIPATYHNAVRAHQDPRDDLVPVSDGPTLLNPPESWSATRPYLENFAVFRRDARRPIAPRPDAPATVSSPGVATVRQVPPPGGAPSPRSPLGYKSLALRSTARTCLDPARFTGLIAPVAHHARDPARLGAGRRTKSDRDSYA